MLLLPLPRRVPAGVTFEAAWALLMAELEHWPGWRLTSIGPGGSWGARDPEGGRVEGVGSYRTWMTDYWQACSDEEGWEYRGGHLQGDGKTPIEAIADLAADMKARRTEPHRFHVEDPWQEGRFVTGCAECVFEAATYFDNEVEWSEA